MKLVTFGTRLIFAWVGCHGITDISVHHDIWITMYSLSCIFGMALPYKYVLGLSYILSGIHFSYDMFPYSYVSLGFLGVLGILITFRKRRWSPMILLGYLSLFHTPRHLTYNLTISNVPYVGGVFWILFISNHIQRHLYRIVYHDELLQPSLKNRALVTIINGHILTHLCVPYNSLLLKYT